MKIPVSVRIKLETYSAERVFRPRERHTEDDDPEYRTYDDVMEDLDEEFEMINSGGGRTVCRLTGHFEGGQDYVAKIVGSPSKYKEDIIPVSNGFVQNWREILLSRVDPIQQYILPVVESSNTGLWLVMPYAEQELFEWDADRTDAKAEQIEELDSVEPVMRGNLGSGLDIYWSSNWGVYQGEYRLLDYGGIAPKVPIGRRRNEYPYIDPANLDPGYDPDSTE